MLKIFTVAEKPESVSIHRGIKQTNINLTVSWQPPLGPKTFVANCEHEYIVTLVNSKDPNDRKTATVPGTSYHIVISLFFELATVLGLKWPYILIKLVGYSRENKRLIEEIAK